MPMRRRDFLTRSGFVLGGTLTGLSGLPVATARGRGSLAPEDWDAVRAAFDLDPAYRHFAAFVLAAHPAPVRDAVAEHRAGLDSNTRVYMNENESQLDNDVDAAAQEYLGADPESIAFTDNTTMGIGLVYGAMRLRPGQEVLTTYHDFYATHESWRLRALKDGAKVRKIRLYRALDAVTGDEIVSRLRKALKPNTRVVALTWVHSSTGLKLPIRRIASMLERVNSTRDRRDHVLLCVDGVHGLGVEPESVDELGCDFLIAGTHKWLWGPRGTGIVWGSKQGWRAARATIPTFDGRSYRAWIDGVDPSEYGLTPAAALTPGGYHSFEHRWALAQAFRWHLEIGKEQVATRTRELGRQLKEGLAEMDHVRLRTPIGENLSSGIVCFDVDGQEASEVVDYLLDQHQIIASVTPYAVRHVRMGPSVVTSPEDVDAALAAIAALA